MKQKKKCYAIHYVGKNEDVIVTSWDECQRLTKGRNNMFKGFMSEEEAKLWLASITKQSEERHNQLVEKSKAIKKAQKEKVAYQFRIDKEMSDDLDKKLLELHLTVDRLMGDLISDYLYCGE